MKAVIKRFCKLLLGWVLLLLGIGGLFLPLLQGVLFIFLGVALLSSESEWVRRGLEALKNRFPRQAARLQRLRNRLLVKFRRRRSL
ncbi:MAG: PGPGW domain-containing protein [Candidatus Binatia bacterium]